MRIAYKTVYPCWVLDEVKSGKEVFVLDKSCRSIESINDMTIKRALGLIESAEKSKNGRYEFWYEETETEETKVTEENEND